MYQMARNGAKRQNGHGISGKLHLASCPKTGSDALRGAGTDTASKTTQWNQQLTYPTIASIDIGDTSLAVAESPPKGLTKREVRNKNRSLKNVCWLSHIYGGTT